MPFTKKKAEVPNVVLITKPPARWGVLLFRAPSQKFQSYSSPNNSFQRYQKFWFQWGASARLLRPIAMMWESVRGNCYTTWDVHFQNLRTYCVIKTPVGPKRSLRYARGNPKRRQYRKLLVSKHCCPTFDVHWVQTYLNSHPHDATYKEAPPCVVKMGPSRQSTVHGRHLLRE